MLESSKVITQYKLGKWSTIGARGLSDPRNSYGAISHNGDVMIVGGLGGQ